MTGTPRIGDGRFATPLELLPGERLLWSGGPALRAVVVQFLRTGVLLLLPALFLGFMFFYPVLNGETSSDDAGSQPASHRSDCQDATARPCAQETANPAQRAAPKQKSPEELAEEARFQTIATIVVSSFIAVAVLFLLGMLIDSLLRVRRAWYVITSERVCIRSGGWSQTLTVIDLDKVVSVQAQSTWFEALLDLQTIELTHAGGARDVRSVYQLLVPNPYALTHVLASGPLLSELVNHWLPRDNRRSAQPIHPSIAN